jgi:hypothetical protein
MNTLSAGFATDVSPTSVNTTGACNCGRPLPHTASFFWMSWHMADSIMQGNSLLWVGIQAVVWKCMRYEGGYCTHRAVLLGLRAAQPITAETRLRHLSGTGNVRVFFFKSFAFIYIYIIFFICTKYAHITQITQAIQVLVRNSSLAQTITKSDSFLG